MKNPEAWVETKFIQTEQGLSPSSDVSKVSRGSRFIAHILARVYEPLIANHATGDLLDAGCGYAPLYGVYKDKVRSVTLLDWPDSRHQNELVDLHCDLNGRWDSVGDDLFSTILATDVIEHIQDPLLFFKEAARVLQPGGKILIGAPFMYWIHEEPHDYFRYTEFSLRKFCKESGLVVNHLQPYGGAIEVLCDVSAKLIASKFAAFSNIHFALSKAFYESSLGERLRKSTSHKFPLGYILIAEKPSN